MKIGKNFYYRSSDRKIIIVLLLFAAVCLTLIFFVGGNYKGNSVDGQQDSTWTFIKKRNNNDGQQGEGYYATEERSVELFPFDPNTADSTALLRLGLQPWQVRNIYKYRAHGGIYRQPSDFAKVYGLTVKQYRQLEPYIRISPDYQPAATLVKGETSVRDTLQHTHKLKEGEHVLLNTADTTALMLVPGIGSYYAKAIVRYGERLGGYVSVDQLSEIEGFPEEAKKYFQVDASHATHRLNINKLSLSDLRRHPYIGFYRAKAITDYRRLHGNIKDLNELSLDRDFPAPAIARLRPYVEY